VGKVAREPQLSEWTERASRCDRLKTPVGLLIILTDVSNTELTISLYIITSA
jgi:CTP synthase